MAHTKIVLVTLCATIFSAIVSSATAQSVSSEYNGSIVFRSGRLGNVANMRLAAHEGDSTYTGTITPPAEYSQNLNSNSGNLANAANMTLAAHETGSTYTGTITPPAAISVNLNTYQLGGGSGTLTLPSVQLTGSDNLLVTNGGEVRLEGANTYGGATRINGKYHRSVPDQAVANDSEVRDGYADNEICVGATLTVTNLANGRVATNIGTSSIAAANLVVQGSTLKYVGVATDTDRLSAIGIAGATIDASGTGALTFGNTGALGIDLAEDRTGIILQAAADSSSTELFSLVLCDVRDLDVGMAIRDIATGVLQSADDDGLAGISEAVGSDAVVAPEPTSLLLACLAVVGMLGRRRRLRSAT
jgi:autotransporter-associated beta strand protein